MARDPSDAGRSETPDRGPEAPADKGHTSTSEQVPPDGHVRCVDRTLLEALVCPVRKTTLFYDAERQELISPAADLAFPIEDGVPILVPQFARGLNDEDRRRYRIK